MPTYVAFLRGINVGGKNKVPMAELRDLMSQLGFKNPRTLLQSGNAVFESDETSISKLEKALEGGIKERFGISVDLMVRTGAHLKETADSNPFPSEAAHSPHHLLVLFMKEPVAAGGVDALQAAIKGPELVRRGGSEVYMFFPDDIGHSKVTSKIMDKHLGASSTGRNWNTVLKLLEMCG